jgi:hypothetical protein
MEHPYMRAYWFAGFAIIVITVIIVLSKAFEIRKKVKDFSLYFFITSLIIVIHMVAFRLIIERDIPNFWYALDIMFGCAYGNIEFFIMKKRLEKNAVKNSFFIPSIFFFILSAFALPLFFLRFFRSPDFIAFRSRIFAFAMNSLLGYSGVLYWRFLLLERKIGTIYFARKYHYHGLMLKKQNDNDNATEKS